MEKRLTADLNVVANSNLEIQLLDGDLNIIQKLDDEPNDVGGLTSAELKAKFDESGNIIKKYINETLIPSVLTDDATEESRKQAEAARVAAEQGRVTAEEGRVSAESGRVSAEQARANAEASRVSAETARVQAETARADETAGIVARATAQANAAAGSASQAAGSEQAAQSAANTASSAASSASQSATAASGSASQAQASAAAAAQSAASVDGVNKTAQSWAVGGTGTRPGEDTNNAKYWAGQAQAAVGGDFATKTEAQGYVTEHNQSAGAHADIRAAVAGSVRYDEAQSLTDAQKSQARGNINAAPGGFGLGTTNVSGKLYDANNCVKNGWYICNVNTPNNAWWYVFTAANYSDAVIVQKAWYYNSGKVIECMRLGWLDVSVDRGGGWQPWEYVNPPMVLGTEYRTTERYLGRPVYTQVFQAFESLAKGGSVYSAPISNVDKVISCTGETYGWNLPSDVIGGETIGNYIHLGTQKLSTSVQVFAITDRDSWPAAVYVTLRYTKTTD